MTQSFVPSSTNARRQHNQTVDRQDTVHSAHRKRILHHVDQKDLASLFTSVGVLSLQPDNAQG